jgi:hypothetical protein
MAELSVTSRTKTAVRRWAGLEPDAGLVLDEALDDLRPDASAELRVEINREFDGNRGFPITTAEWNGMDLGTVRDVRDRVNSRLRRSDA